MNAPKYTAIQVGGESFFRVYNEDRTAVVMTATAGEPDAETGFIPVVAIWSNCGKPGSVAFNAAVEAVRTRVVEGPLKP